MTEQPKPGPHLDIAVGRAVGWQITQPCASPNCSCDQVFCGVIEQFGSTYRSRYPSQTDADAIAALEATGCTCIIRHFPEGMLPEWRWNVQLVGVKHDHGSDGRTLPEAASLAIIALSKAKEPHPNA